tara:strand:+ start:434 stop:652 length:219 start_codon:yes stop_codon:yes gene_type:complete
MSKLQEQFKLLHKKGLLEGFLDTLTRKIKQLTDKQLDKIVRDRNKDVADFISDYAKNPDKYAADLKRTFDAL